MKWEEITQLHPSRFVLVEAIKELVEEFFSGARQLI